MEHFYKNIGEDWMDYENLYSQMVEEFSDGSHFVEVGSWKGRSASYMAVEIIKYKKIIKFDCVDTWEGSSEHLNINSMHYVKELSEDKDWLFNQFKENTSSVSTVINPIKKNSVDASKLYEDESLDFVFIDASHEYDDVKNDINSWYPKVKKGGYLCGHDYNNFIGVTQAVNELIIGNDRNCSVINSSWIHKK